MTGITFKCTSSTLDEADAEKTWEIHIVPLPRIKVTLASVRYIIG